MGTIVRAGSGIAVVVATGPRTAFGRIAVGLSHRQPDTEFQIGLRRFSVMLAWVAGVLTTAGPYPRMMDTGWSISQRAAA